MTLRFLAVVAAAIGLVSGATAATLRTQTGTLPDSTPYRIDVPEAWNGTVFLDLDYAMRPNPADVPQTRILMERGYAFAGTTRSVTGWAVHKSVENLVEVGRLVETAFGKPRWKVAYGGSLGGHTAATAAHLRPDVFAGAVVMCASPAGAIGLWNGKLDALFVAKTLLAPESDLPIVDVPADFNQRAVPAWKEMLARAQQTPEGRARIALAAVLGQLPDWSVPTKPKPAREDTAARQEGLYDSFAGGPLPLIGQAMSSRRQISGLAGGNVSWNTGVDYAAALKRLPNKSLVETLYRQAGLDLNADFKKLEAAPRIAVDPHAAEYLLPQSLDGLIRIPMLTMNNTGDQIGPVASVWALDAAAKNAGASDLLRQVVTEGAGHCGFTTAENVVAAETLMLRLQAGRWPDTSPKAMTERARTLDPGPTHFIAYGREPFLRTFTIGDLKALQDNARK